MAKPKRKNTLYRCICWEVKYLSCSWNLN